MAKEKEPEIQWFTGQVINIGRSEGDGKPRKVELQDDPNAEYAKTCRVFEHKYKEDEDDEDEINPVFEKLQEFRKSGETADVRLKVRKYQAGGKWRTQNLITGIWPEGEAPDDPHEDEGEHSEPPPKKKTTRKSTAKKTTAGSSSVPASKKAEFETFAEIVAEKVIAKMRAEGGAVLGQKPSDEEGWTADPKVDEQVWEDFLQTAEEEGFTVKSLQKKFEKLYGEGDVTTATTEQLTGIAEALDIEWT